MPKPSQGTNASNPSRLQPRAAGRGEQPLCSWGFSISSGDSAELGPRKSRSPPLQAGITFQQSRARFHRALVCNKTPAAARARCPGNSAQAAHCGPSLGTIRSFSLVFYRYLISQPHVFNVPPAPLRAPSTSTALGDLCAPRSTAPLVSPSETKDSQ